MKICNRRRDVALALAVLAQTVAMWGLLSDGFFFTDDFLFARQAEEATFSLQFLRLSLFEHFSPVHRAINFAFVRWAPFEFSYALLIGLFLLGACVFVFDRLVRLLFGDSWLVFALTVAYGGSLFFVRALRWWTAAVHLLPATLLGLLCLYAFVRWQLSGSRRWLIVSVGVFWASLLTHEQAALSLGYLLLVRLLLLGDQLSIRSIARALWTERWAWAAYCIGSAVSMWNFLATYYFSVRRPPVDVVLEAIWRGFGEGFAPGLVGFRLPETVLISTVLTTWLAVAAVVGVCMWSVIKGPRAWRAWAAFALVFLANIVPLALNRAALFGPTVTRDVVYQLGIHYFFLIALGFAFHPRFAGRRGSGVTSLNSLSRPLVCAVVTTALLVNAVTLARSVRSMFATDPLAHATKAYVKTFTSGIAKVRSEGIEPTIFNAKVPERLMPDVFVPYNRQNRFLAVVDSTVSFNATGKPGFRVRDDGSLERSAFVPVSTVQLPSAHGAGEARVSNGSMLSRRHGGDEVCFITRVGAALELRVGHIRLAAPAFLRIAHRVDGPVPVKVAVDDGRGVVPANANDSVWTPRENSSYEDLDVGELRSVVVSFGAPGRTICLGEFAFGHLQNW